MRIIAGKLKGRIFASSRNRRTHPMSDRMRGALFNVLGDISGLQVLDAFSGTGAIAIESVSRGADFVAAVERDKRAYKKLTENIDKLGLSDNIRATRANVASWSNTNASRQFDVVICDPPYDDLQVNTLQKLLRHVAPSGTFVVSAPAWEEPMNFRGASLVQANKHAGGQLLFYRA